jgi:hypothetical protein
MIEVSPLYVLQLCCPQVANYSCPSVDIYSHPGFGFKPHHPFRIEVFWTAYNILYHFHHGPGSNRL